MLRYLIDFSLRRTGVVLLASGLLLGGAGFLLPKMRVDVFPELNAPTVVVLTEAPGLAAEETEQYVTFPIESGCNGLPGVRRVRSSSAAGLSLVWVEFDWGADLFRARQLVAERLAAARESLPENAHAEITPMTSITGEIMLLALSSPGGATPDVEVRAFAEFELRNRIHAVPGVAQVGVIGGRLPEHQVRVDQERLAAYDLALTDVVAAARAAHSTATGGYLADVDRKELPIRQIARVRSIDDVRATVVKLDGGAPVTLGQVADVGLGGAPRRGTAADRAVPAVVLNVQKSPGVDTLALTAAVDAALDEVERALPAGLKLNRLVFRQADFIKRSIDNVAYVMRDAAIIVAVVLVLFLLNLRTTLITLTALPLSFGVALLVLEAFGMGVNVMTLGGLAVAVGELVDDAIIDVENIFRRLKENAALPEAARRPLVRVVFDASNEIRSSIVFATILIVLVFAPMMLLEGVEGRFFRPLGLTYVVSILASLLVALTVTPALCKLLLRGRLGGGAHGDGPLVRVLKRVYEPALRWSIRRKGVVLAGSALGAAFSLALAASFGSSFLPTFNEGTFTVFLMAPPGTSLDESDRLARGVEARLVEIRDVVSVTRRTGRAERDEHAEPPSSSEIEVVVAKGADAQAVRRGIDAVLSAVPGVTTMIGQPIEHRLSHLLSGVPAAIAINVFGQDLDVLRGVAKRIEAALKGVPGARDVNASREVMIETAPVRYRPADLAAAGLTAADAAEQFEQAWAGARVAEINQGARRVDLVVRLADDERRTVAQLGDFLLRGSQGARVRLREVADVSVERAAGVVARENGRRKAVVSCNVAEGANLGDLVAEVRRIVDPIVASAGCSATYGGQFEARQEAVRTLGVYGAVVLGLMALLLRASSGSLRTAFLVMLNLPLALIGGVVAVFLAESKDPAANAVAWISGEGYVAPVLSLSSLVGFITLFGIAVRNGILLVNHYAHVMTAEGKPLAVAVVEGSLERLVPILMTALSAALGLIPLALAADKPGGELLAPLAIVVLGGLISSTFLNLFVVPAGYALVHGAGVSRFFRRPRAGDSIPGDSPPAQGAAS